MTIAEIIKHKDIDTYYKLKKLCKSEIDKPGNKIKLGDSIENLMRADSYERRGRRIRQKGWG